MPMLVAGLAGYLGADTDSIPAFNGGNIYHGNVKKTDEAILKTVAAYGCVMGVAGSHRRGIKFTPPSKDKNYFENLFIMMGIVDPATGAPDPIKLSCFRRVAVLNTDHGMALSVFANLVTTSSLTDPISGVIASLTAAYGPLHFGAPESAYKTMSKIGRPENVPAFLDDVKSGRSRLFGYGHRTYKTVDPRLGPIKEMLLELNVESDPLFKIACEIDRVASTDEYFLKRGLHANADFYGVFHLIGT
jgi:citrate synthase